MNYQYVFHGVEQDAPASLRVREREDWPIEAGAPTLTEARRLVHLVRVRVNTTYAKAVPRVGHERGREFWVSETRKRKEKRRIENG